MKHPFSFIFPDKPFFPSNEISVFELVEGQPSSINVTASANPDVVEYTWSKVETATDKLEALNLDNGRLSMNEGSLNFTTVNRSDEGVYEIKARNAEGEGRTKIHVKVFYPPKIVDITGTQRVKPGSPAHFECAVDAWPMTQSTIAWKRGRVNELDDATAYDMAARTKMTAGGARGGKVGAVMLTVINATAEDSGVFVCEAYNGVGDVVVRKTTYLLVDRK